MTAISSSRAAYAPVPPSLGDLISQSGSLAGKTILLVFNPAARDGRVAKELSDLKAVLKNAGAALILVETLPDATARRELIRGTVTRVLAEIGPGKSLYVVPYGGDGTIWETVGEAVKAVGGSLQADPAISQALQSLPSRIQFFLVRKGTAADNAVQVIAPKEVPRIPGSMAAGVSVPFWPSVFQSATAPDQHQMAGHSLTIGVSGFLFHRRRENRLKNPDAFHNKGLISFFKILPRAILHRYGLLGFDAQLSHVDANGNLIRKKTVRASDIIITPNHIMAKVGGVPGSWGEMKVVVLPPGPRGLLGMGEAIFRRVATGLDWNLLGPDASLRTLPADNKWSVRPGESLDIRLLVPSSRFGRLGWNLLYRFDPKIPAPGSPLEVLAQSNGDPIPASSGFAIRPLAVPIGMLARPDSLAAQLFRHTTLARNQTLPFSDQQVTSLFPEASPGQWSSAEGSYRVRTPFLSAPRLNALFDAHGVPRQYAVELLLASQGHHNVGSQTRRLGDPGVTVERATEFLATREGHDWVARYRDRRGAFQERLKDGGVPLATGVIAMLGGEALADSLGLDPIRDRELRFGLVTYTSHAVQSNVRPLWNVFANRWMARPYDFLQTRSVYAAGELFHQWSLESRSSLLGALGSSWASRNLGIEMGLTQSIKGRLKTWSGLPFRSAWNMGEGLIFSRATEFLLNGLPEDSKLRHYAPTAAFFAPDLLRLAGGPRVLAVLEAPPMRLAGRAVAAGFIADMAFMTLHRMAHGAGGDYQLYLDRRAADRRRSAGDIAWYNLFRQVPRFLAPSLSAYIDSHDFFFGDGNSYRREIEAEDIRQSAAVRRAVQQGMAWLPSVLQQEPAEIFSQTIELSPLEREMLEQLAACRGGKLLKEQAGFEETARYLKHQFRGPVRNLATARRHLARVYAAELQQSIVGLHHLPLFENATVQALFDASGRVRPGLEEELNRWILTGEADPLSAGFRRGRFITVS